MTECQVTIDLTYAKNALFVRQTVAVAFGIPIDRELTWPILQERICDPANLAIPKKILVEGLSGLGIRVPDEERMLISLLLDLRVIRPDIEVMILLHTQSMENSQRLRHACRLTILSSRPRGGSIQGRYATPGIDDTCEIFGVNSHVSRIETRSQTQTASPAQTIARAVPTILQTLPWESDNYNLFERIIGNAIAP